MPKRLFVFSVLVFLLALPSFTFAESAEANEDGHTTETEEKQVQIEESEDEIQEIEEKEEVIQNVEVYKTEELQRELSAAEWYEFAMDDHTASGRVEKFSEAYNLFPNDQKIVSGYNASVENLLNWASGKHNKGQYSIAIDRYDYIMTLSGILDTYKSEAEWKKSFAVNNLNYPEPEKLYELAMEESTASGRFDAFYEAYQIFPSNVKIKKGYLSSADNLFNYALERHILGDFEKAIDRYNHILSSGGIEQPLESKINARITEAKNHKLPADAIYTAAVNEYSASKKLELFIQGYESYPNEKRFQDGIIESALGLLNWAKGQHENGKFETAKDRYHMILNAPTISNLMIDSMGVHIDYANNNKLIPTLDSLKSKIKSETKVSSIFEQSKENILFYPDVVDFQKGLNSASRKLLDWAVKQHNNEDFITAIERYDMILSVPYIDTQLQEEASRLKESAVNGVKSADAYYKDAVNEGRASYKLAIFVEGYRHYPNDSRFVKGINSSATSLLDWAISKHNSGNYETAIDRYETILSSPMVSNSLLNTTTLKLEEAKIGKRPADIIYNLIKKENSASGLFDLNSEGLKFYPDDSRFQKGLVTSSESLYNLAIKYHNQNKFTDALSRYQKLIETKGVPSIYRTKAEYLLKYAQNNSSIPTLDNYSKLVGDERTASGKLEVALESYWIYEGDSRTIKLVKDSAKGLLNWATTKHQAGSYEVALERYNIVLGLPIQDKDLTAEAKIKAEYAMKNQILPTSDALYQEAIEEYSASRQLELYLSGLILYPGDNRFETGVADSSQSLLVWASKQQDKGRFDVAIDRYVMIIDSPGVPHEIVLNAQLRKEYALKNMTIPTANELYNLAKNDSTASGAFQYNLEGYVFYPNDSRFEEGIITSSQELFAYANRLHTNKKFTSAISRYEVLVDSPGVPKYIAESATLNIQYAQIEKMPPSEVFQYTDYGLTLKDALNMQMKVSPQTDKYRNYPAFVSDKSLDIFDGGVITGSSVNLRTSTSLGTNNNVYKSVTYGTAFIVLDDNVKGDTFSGSTRWYKIEYNGKVLYVHSTLSKINSRVGRATTNVNVYADTNSSSHIYGTIKKGSLVSILKEGNNWHEISYGAWRNATSSDVMQYLDPNNIINDEKQIFQFVDLSKPSGVTASSLNNYLRGKGHFDGQGQAFIDAGLKNGVNDLYLVAHAMLETGHGTSTLSKGYKYNGVTVYNFFGIGAYDKCPVECGVKKAYEEGWTTPYKAIVGGAKFIGDSYIRGNNSANTVQNTLYEMRWNPQFMAENGYAYHQYATDIGWASKQINILYDLYKELDYYVLNLDIPVYR